MNVSGQSKNQRKRVFGNRIFPVGRNVGHDDSSCFAKREIDVQQPYLAREYGVARYERIRDEGFVEADRYFERTRKFWDEVRDAWSSTFARYSTITLRGPVDKLGLFEPLFAQAGKLTEHPDTATDNAKVIDHALGEMGVPRQQKSRRAR